MTERQKDFAALGTLLALLILFFAKILFTDKIIRAPDITTEFYWTVKHFKEMGFVDLFTVNLRAGWDMLANGGGTEGGGTLSMQFLFYRNLIFWLFPAPANVAWFIVFHLFVGGAGTYVYCRAIGAGRGAALLGGIIFALAPENASLINAGHVQKIATISFAPWAFYFFERGFQARRVIWFLATGFVLAFQFFNMHWQIAFYTCLGIGAYGLLRSVVILFRERDRRGRSAVRLVGLNLVTMFFFLSTVAISLIPLADWSKETTRGVQSGANQGQGGLQVEEAMSWSLPPEELVTFVVPGFFGLSRQEGAYDSPDNGAYYWGRMAFTQTTDYFGLLPWLLAPLPLIFRRDRYTWLAVAAVAGGLLFSFGKYTPFYWFLYEHFPGVNHFRVPKMMMFIPVFGMAILAARGLDLLLDPEIRARRGFSRYLLGIFSLAPLLLAALGASVLGRNFWIDLFSPQIAQPNRFEDGLQLVMQRWHTIEKELSFAALFAVAYAVVIGAFSRQWLSRMALALILAALFLADVGRVNAKFLLLQDPPQSVKGVATPVIDYLSRQPKGYRVLPMDGSDPMQYVSHGIPVMFTSAPVQVQRWQDFLDGFNFASAMPDMMNVRYLVYGAAQYQQERSSISPKFQPVFTSPDGTQVVLENKEVLPKGWLVSQALLLSDPRQTLGILPNPAFSPGRVALVEEPPVVPLAPPSNPVAPPAGNVTIATYEWNRIAGEADTPGNALLVLGEKFYKGWRATVDGSPVEVRRVDYILRGIYLSPGRHRFEFVFDPLPFKVGKYLTLASFALFAAMLGREWRRRRTVGA
ncbi:membrane protein [Geobacter pickeringii]|uniref:Membrane protein n=1 Tax=Geobacter pickeringii TaxID=345632 RepID=A0A0B5BGA9_9BACT|nr:membrane protein [Geobacter pickeringii]AJE04184.1 membrane protein [Geobacter pickeringii]